MKPQSLVLLAVALVAAGAAGCFKDPVSNLRSGGTRLSLDHQDVYLRTGDSVAVLAELKDNQGNIVPTVGATWEVVDATVAAVRMDTVVVPGNYFTRGFIRGVNTIGGWTNVVVTVGNVADTIRVVVMPATIDASLVARAGTALTDTVIVPASLGPPATPRIYRAYSAPDTLILNGTSLLQFDTSKVTVSVATTNGASKGFIVYKTPTRLKVVFASGTAGKVLVRHWLLTPGNSAVGTIALDSLFADSTAVRAFHFADGTFGGGVAQVGDTMTVTAGTNQLFTSSTLVTFTSASDTLLAVDTAYITAFTPSTLTVLAPKTRTGQRVTLRKSQMTASGTGVATITFDSLKTHSVAFSVNAATLPAASISQAGDTMTINAIAPMTFTDTTLVRFGAATAVIFVRTATQLQMLSPVAYTGVVEVDSANVGISRIPALKTVGNYTMNAAFFQGAVAFSPNPGASKRLMDTVTVAASPGTTFDTAAAKLSNIILGPASVNGDTAWVLSRTVSQMVVLPKRGGGGAAGQPIKVTNVVLGNGVVLPSLATSAKYPIDSINADYTMSANLAGSHVTVIPVSNVDTVYGAARCPALTNNGCSAASWTADYWTFTTAAPAKIGINVGWFGTGNPYGAATDIQKTADYDIVLCDNTMTCDENDASELTGYAMATASQPEKGTSGTLAAGQYWVGILPWTGPYTVVYRLIITLQ